MNRLMSLVGIAVMFSAFAWETVPPPPAQEDWQFVKELAKPVNYHARVAYKLNDRYGLKGNLETVSDDLARFFASAPQPAQCELTLERGKVEGRESYRVEVASDGAVKLVAEDDEGMRRAVYYFEDRNAAGDLKPIVRRCWLRNRITRCFFAPIKRPPHNRDELMDDVDYYPDAYLNRLAHEGVNGLWLTVELRNLVKTSFNELDLSAPRRLAKLRRTVEKCNRYGIRTWIFCIEPRRLEPGDPLFNTLPSDALVKSPWYDGDKVKIVCPQSPVVRQYIEEAFRDLFTQVPGLPGIINISHGERPTTCLSWTDSVDGTPTCCPRCAKLEPWQLHNLTVEAMLKGMRAANPQAEVLSWFYSPYVAKSRAPWVAECARHLPDGVTMLYNFESGAVKEQLGRYRSGGDYWLSYVGPSPIFEKVAEAARQSGGRLGAKIQVGCSHECATVPFVPVPGLLYRKYAAMKSAGCDTVMQCWYFGNYPGVMNMAAGELAFEDFSREDESAFLERLARSDWGDDAAVMAKFWLSLSDAYGEYPLSNDMQYYGPFHCGVAWPLLPEIELKPLSRTWKPDGPSGDAIGECLENHTLNEAAILSARMSEGAADCRQTIADLERRYVQDADRRLDLGVVKALGLLFESGADIFEFYRQRELAVEASRFERDFVRARVAVRKMRAIVTNERNITKQMLELANGDSRLGFHSEAESHQFHPAKLEWRLKELECAERQLENVEVELAASRPYPKSKHEITAPVIVCGKEIATTGGYRILVNELTGGDLRIDGFSPCAEPLIVRLYNLCATVWPLQIEVSPEDCVTLPKFNAITPRPEICQLRINRVGNGFSFSFVINSRTWEGRAVRRPEWLHLSTEQHAVWPQSSPEREGRLNLGNVYPCDYGRIVR